MGIGNGVVEVLKSWSGEGRRTWIFSPIIIAQAVARGKLVGQGLEESEGNPEG